MTLTKDMLEALYKNTHGIIDQLIGLCMYMNLDYITSSKRPSVDADYINRVAKRHYSGIQKLMDSLNDPLAEKERQRIMKASNLQLDNLLQEYKQAAFTQKIMDNNTSSEKMIPLKKNIIRNIQMVTNDYSIEKISLAIDEVLSATNETDEQILTRVVMKQLLDKANQTSKKKRTSPKQKPLTSDMVNYIIG